MSLTASYIYKTILEQGVHCQLINDSAQKANTLNTELAILAAIAEHVKEQEFQDEAGFIQQLKRLSFQYDMENNSLAATSTVMQNQEKSLPQSINFQTFSEELKQKMLSASDSTIEASINLQIALLECKNIDTVTESLLAAKEAGLTPQEIRKHVGDIFLQLERSRQASPQTTTTFIAPSSNVSIAPTAKEKQKILIDAYIQAQRQDLSLQEGADSKTQNLFKAEKYAILLIKYGDTSDLSQKSALLGEISALEVSDNIVNMARDIMPRSKKHLHKSKEELDILIQEDTMSSQSSQPATPSQSTIANPRPRPPTLATALNMAMVQVKNNAKLKEATEQSLRGQSLPSPRPVLLDSASAQSVKTVEVPLAKPEMGSNLSPKDQSLLGSTPTLPNPSSVQTSFNRKFKTAILVTRVAIFMQKASKQQKQQVDNQAAYESIISPHQPPSALH